ncbi:MAG: hypothetical protein AAF488_12380 [Planctomycetota bacterium]
MSRSTKRLWLLYLVHLVTLAFIGAALLVYLNPGENGLGLLLLPVIFVPWVLVAGFNLPFSMRLPVHWVYRWFPGMALGFVALATDDGDHGVLLSTAVGLYSIALIGTLTRALLQSLDARPAPSG